MIEPSQYREFAKYLKLQELPKPATCSAIDIFSLLFYLTRPGYFLNQNYTTSKFVS